MSIYIFILTARSGLFFFIFYNKSYDNTFHKDRTLNKQVEGHTLADSVTEQWYKISKISHSLKLYASYELDAHSYMNIQTRQEEYKRKTQNMSRGRRAKRTHCIHNLKITY